MKVLMIADGRSIHAKRPLNWLLEKGCEVIFCDATNPYPEGFPQYQFQPFPIAKGTGYFPKLFNPKIADWLLQWTIILQLRRLWQQVRPDVVHVHWVDYRAYYCVKAGIKPLVLTVWGSDINRHFLPNADSELSRITGKALSGANQVIVDAPEMIKKCSLLAGKDIPTKILPLGIDTKLFRPGYDEEALEWRRRLEIPTDAKVLLSIRAWYRNYNHHLILEAFAQALPFLKTKSILVFKLLNPLNSTDSDAYEIEIRHRAEELGVSQSVRWIKAVPLTQLPELYALADIIISYPSIDAFPVTFLEAAACERPVITCQLPAYSDSFAEKFFCLVEPENVSDLAKAIMETININTFQSHCFLSKIRKLIKQEYDESITVQKLVDIYRNTV